MSPDHLYLALLKKSLTHTLFAAEPDANQSLERLMPDFVEHYIRGAAITMLPMSRLDNIQFCVDQAIQDKISGDLIETGVWRGGATIFMRGLLMARDISDRTVWVADSFEGLPEPDKDAYPLEAKTHAGPVMTKLLHHFAADLDQVKANFAAFDLLDDRVQFLKGWFKDTLPTAPIQHLAVMRLDGDYYESTWDALVNLYHRLSPGGYCIIDDYGEDDWTYCRKAVDEFRLSHNIHEPLIKVDSKCHYWRRSA